MMLPIVSDNHHHSAHRLFPLSRAESAHKELLLLIEFRAISAAYGDACVSTADVAVDAMVT